MFSVCLYVKHRTLEKMNTSAKISLCISTRVRLRESESVSVSNSNIPSIFTNTSCSCHQGAPLHLLSSPPPSPPAGPTVAPSPGQIMGKCWLLKNAGLLLPLPLSAEDLLGLAWRLRLLALSLQRREEEWAMEEEEILHVINTKHHGAS